MFASLRGLVKARWKNYGSMKIEWRNRKIEESPRNVVNSFDHVTAAAAADEAFPVNTT